MSGNLAERIAVEGYGTCSLLAAVYRNCAGALQFLPDGVDSGPADGISGRPLGDDFWAIYFSARSDRDRFMPRFLYYEPRLLTRLPFNLIYEPTTFNSGRYGG